MARMIVNGQAVDYRVDPATPLLTALRAVSNLTGTKHGCGTGDCGACTVHLDGAAALACQVAVGGLEGAEVVTIEGLSRDRSHPVQQAWAAEGAVGCGWCTPGFIMAAAALLARNGQPADADIATAMPHLCRCGIHPRVVRAVRRAARAMAGRDPLAAAPPPGIDAQDAAEAVPALRPRPRD